MPKKIARSEKLHTLVQERLRVWGSCIKKQRITQKIAVKDLCARMDISDATLRRLEKGDPGAGVGSYMSALLILGVFDKAVPLLDLHLWTPSARSRVRVALTEGDDDDF